MQNAKISKISKCFVSDRYYNEDGRYDDAPDNQERGYYYGENYIETLNGEFLEFDISDTRFKVLTKYFEGGIGVSSHISVFKGFKDGMLSVPITILSILLGTDVKIS